MNITDQAGRSLQLSDNIQRIVSLAPSNTEIIYALKAGDLLCGVTEYCDYPPEAKLKKKVGGYSTVDIQRIKGIKPDLILAGMIHLKEVLPQLEKLNYNTLVLEANSTDELFQAIKLCGICTGRQRTADLLATSLQKRAQAVTAKTSLMSRNRRPKVYYLHELQTWKTFGAKTIGDTLTELAGGYNVGRDFGDYYPYPTIEDIVRSNPDIIIAETGYGQNPEEPLQVIHSEERLSGTKARVENRIYGIDSDLISRAGPRLVEGLEQLARIIHPEISWDVDVDV
jgi:iron complex transport system substrate-binding protein